LLLVLLAFPERLSPGYNGAMSTTDPLALFLPAVQEWFRTTLGEPTPPQVMGWPSIARGRHTLILAPTGSGKTLAAFLACLDHLWRQQPLPRGVKVLYISPLKALNNDIHRNLQAPLEGVAATARRLGTPLPHLEAAVRTGDTPTSERQRLLRKPPHVLITTPESLHLLLTSRGRDTLRDLTHVIVDEIHALCANKRGVFLSLLLERLEAIQRRKGTFVRIGLSATQRPLEEVARYLGGQVIDESGQVRPRPVAIIDAGLRKDLDLGILNPVEQFGPLPEKSVWPSIYRLLGEQIRAHRSTLVFANDRRSVERITSFLNEDEELARAHHGSVSLEMRQQIEAALKEGRLPAVCATASLELGIDMGAVDLVCQVASPGNVARALQRVGRAGHIVGQKSKGRFVPRTQADLLEQAVLVREMIAGRVEEIRCPKNCLDVLAQQIVALASMDDWGVPDLFALVRRAYPYRDLTAQAFEATLEMVSGRYRFAPVAPSSQAYPSPQPPPRSGEGEQETKADDLAGTSGSPAPPPRSGEGVGGRGPLARGERPASLEALQPRVSWDRVHNRLVALPGSQHTALVNGGTIPDTGEYGAYLSNGTRIGELDEEFVYERRVGDAFLLGTNAWRLERIDADRVIVSAAEGAPAMVPFWRGEGGGRSYDLGRAIGAFLRELTDRLQQPQCLDWLTQEHHMDRKAARSLQHHVSRQLLTAGCVPSDRTLLVEASRDPLGDWQVILLSPFGSRLHLSLRLAVEGQLRRRLGYQPQCLHHDDGILVRLTDTDEPILDLLSELDPAGVESLVLDELADSALFALRFRQNAARALLLPRGQAGKRAPLWLQRLRGRDLLQVARRHPDFPVVVETFRECLHDHLDVPRLRELLEAVRKGEVQVVTRRGESPSPFAAGLLFSFTAAYMYQYDRVDGEKTGAGTLDRELLGQLVGGASQEHLLDPRAVHQVDRRLRGLGMPPRSVAEMAEWLRRLGDLAPGDLEGPMRGFLEKLCADGRAQCIELPGAAEPKRWIAAEKAELYRTAFGLEDAAAETRQTSAVAILERYLDTHALVGLTDVLARYPFERAWAERQLQEWVRSGRAVAVERGGDVPLQYSAPGNLEQVQRGSLGLLRREVIACQPAQLADFVLRWQRVHPAERRGESVGLAAVLERLQGLPLPAELWEQTVLPARVPGYQPRWLDEWIAGGSGAWVAQGEGDSGAGQVAFFSRALLLQLSPPERPGPASASEDAQKVSDLLLQRGASFTTDLACDSGLTPSRVRAALWELARRGEATNDHFDVVRRGEQPDVVAAAGGSSKALTMRSLRRFVSQRPEGRWSLLRWGRPAVEEVALAQCLLLLERYGLASRELAGLDPWLLSWRVLYEVLSRLELSGEVRRGYFVEGLSGAQFASPEAAALLQERHAPSTAAEPLVLLHSMDPANLYGAGAPFDVPLLDGGTRPLLRRAGNWLVLKAGRPVLLVEQQGRKLTALASASAEEVSAAAACLPGMFDQQKGLTGKHKLTVQEWNGRPVTQTEGRELLERAGFVRDYQGMTLYAAWR
jgi:ATP-dependent Lhr-like helicase